MKHKHAELIKAWVDGAEVQYRWRHWHANDWEEWKDLTFLGDFNDAINFEYRIKPEPKPEPKLDELFINWDDRKNEWFISRSPLTDTVYKIKVEVAK